MRSSGTPPAARPPHAGCPSLLRVELGELGDVGATGWPLRFLEKKLNPIFDGIARRTPLKLMVGEGAQSAYRRVIGWTGSAQCDETSIADER